MNVKKTIKKIAALGASASMVGLTVAAGATSALAQLDDYPSQFMDEGQFDGQIVVGADAKTEDVLGAIDIAASLQAESTTSEQVDVPGGTGGTTVQGDAVEIGSQGDVLSLNEPIGDVRETVTEFELGALQGGTISTDEGSTQYNQYLRFKTSNGSQIFPTSAIYGPNDASEEEVSDWLYMAEGSNDPNGDAFFEWEINFEEGLESETESDGSGNLELNDLEDEVFNIFGTDFVFVDSQIQDNSGDPNLELEFLAGDVTDALQEGETKTYTIDGKEYEVTLVFVSDPSSGGSGGVEAKLSVNGELTDALSDGDTDILADGTEVGVQEILVNNRGGVAEFFLGAQKVLFQDTNTSNNEFSKAESAVEITQENIEDGFVSIRAQADGNASQSGTEVDINSMKYRLTADAITGSNNIYIAPGEGVREYLDEPAGMLSPNFNIRYEGLRDVGETPIDISSNGDDEYTLDATNRQGNTYNIPWIEVDQNNGDLFRFGTDSDEDFVFAEQANTTTNFSAGDDLSSHDFFVDQDDQFLLSNNRDDSWDDQAFSHVLEYQSIDKSNDKLTFEDQATGTKEVTYQDDGHQNVTGTGELVVGGNAYQVLVSDLNNSNNPLAIDLNADGDVDGDRSKFTARGGGVIDFGENQAGPQDTADGGGSFNHDGPGANATFVLHTEASEFDESGEGSEQLRMLASQDSDNQVQLDFVNYTRTDFTANGSSGTTLDRANEVFLEGPGVVSTSGRYSAFEFSPQEPDSDNDHQMEMTDFGVEYDLFDPSGGDPEELTLMYPHQERGAQVFVTAGEVTTTSTNASSGGGVQTEQVNPIAVGLAVLDTNAPAIGTENLIAVGGPAVNRVTAELEGVDYPATGQTVTDLGYEDGTAKIKMYEDQNALLVAGWDAEATLGASYVLADHGDYELTGDEVEVSVASLDSISVSPMSGSGNGGMS